MTYSVKCLAINEVSTALKTAVINNKAVCDKLRGEPKLEYTVWLTPEERRTYWEYHDLFMVKSRFGILLMNDTVCIKTPIHQWSYIILHSLSRSVSLPCIPDYKVRIAVCLTVKYAMIL